MIELWREAIRSLPSETFLDLARNYLGPVRTPYRKHELMEELEALLRKRETADRILSLIDDADAACLSAVMALGSAERGMVADFMGGDRSLALARIVNLEERLLLFESSEEGAGRRRLMVNPLLAEDLRRYAFDPALVFPPAAPGQPEPPAEPAAFPSLDRLDPAAVAAMACFFLAEDRSPRRKLDGELKLPAKAEREFAEAFPAGWESRDAAGFLEAARIFLFSEGKFAFQRAQAEAFFSSSDEARARAAAVASLLPGSAALVRSALACLPEGVSFGIEAIARFILVLRRPGEAGPDRSAALRLAASMARSGCLKRAEDGAPGFARRPLSAPAGGAAIHVGADYHVMVPEGVEAPDLLFLARCLDLVRLGAALELGLNRKSAARSYRSGYGREATEARLARLSGGPLPQNLAYSLESWEREHRSVNIASGILVYGDERLARFMEHSPAMKERVAERVAPGCYLTDFESVEDCERALQRAGMETPPRLVAAGPAPRPPADPALGGAEAAPPPSFLGTLDWGKRREKPPLDPEPFLAALAEKVKSSDFPKEAKEALAERIRLRLVIGQAGLRPDSLRYEKGEAGGLDYLGKVKLIERALREPNWLLDLLYREPSGEIERRTLRPLALHKGPGGLILECAADEAGAAGGKATRIPVDKISNVKRIRLSLFG